MVHYYIMSPKAAKGFDEVPKDEYISLVGDESVRAYISDVYKGTMSIDEVPEELRSKVEEAVANRVEKYGNYDNGVSLPDLNNPGTAEDLMENKELLDGQGEKIIGTMPDNGSISATFDGIDTKSYVIPEGYTSGGTVSLDNTIDNEAATQAALINQISAVLEGKANGSGSTSIETCEVTISRSGLGSDTRYLIYADSQQQYHYVEFEGDTTITVPKNTLIVLFVWSQADLISGSSYIIYQGEWEDFHMQCIIAITSDTVIDAK